MLITKISRITRILPGTGADTGGVCRRMGQIRNMYTFGRRVKLRHYLKVGLTDRGREDVNWIQLALGQDPVAWVAEGLMACQGLRS